MSKKRKPTIAEIIHLAADEFLWDGRNIGIHEKDDNNVFSCLAIEHAVFKLADQIGDERYEWAHDMLDRIEEGLIEMGLDVTKGWLFLDVKDPQACRYAWLKFAAMIAEEQGV